MINNLRNFSKTRTAQVLIAIIIVPFVFWGMGGVFNTGNTNSIAKINNYNISTQDFIDHINTSNLNPDFIKENINQNVLEELLSNLISGTLLDMEIKELKISISDKSLVKRIRKNKNFFGEDGKFSRNKYEKFLLTNNMTAPQFELKLKKNELQKKLFTYISGGLKSPFFMTNKTYKEITKKIEIESLNLESIYKNKDSISEQEIKIFVEENKDDLKEEYIDFSYIKITPKNLTGNDEFDQNYFDKIDELENRISIGEKYKEIINDLKIEEVKNKKYLNIDNKNKTLNEKIYKRRKGNKIQLIDEGEYFILYEITKVEKILPKLDNQIFKNKITKILYQKNKYEFNQKILKDINDNKFKESDFVKLSQTNQVNIEKIQINSINSDKKYEPSSIKLIYSLPVNSFTLVSDKKNNIFLIKISRINEKDITTDSKDFQNYLTQSNMKIQDKIYSSYDVYLNEKYTIKVNEKSLERVKNFFK